MIANIINIVAGLVLTYAAILHPTWTEQRFFPLLGFAIVFLVMALWARRSDPHPWYSWVNIVLAVALGLLSLLPLATMPYLSFWGSFWVGCAVPIVAFWALLYSRDLAHARRNTASAAS